MPTKEWRSLLDRVCDTPPPLQAFTDRVIPRLRLAGGLVNQIFSLQVLVMHAKQLRAAVVAPEFGSHIAGNSMGVKAPKPRSQSFHELFEFDCVAVELRKQGVVLLREQPTGVKLIKPFPKEKLAQSILLKQYSKYKATASGYTGPVFPGGPPLAVARELEDAVYRGLHPSSRLLQRVHLVLARPELREMRYGCVHARIENDMRRWWYHVAKLRPLSMADILNLLSTVETIRRTPTIFVAVGSDLRQSDESLLSRNRTPWDARLIRRVTPGDESGHLLRKSGGDEDPSLLTYVEASLIDYIICRSAAWFAGWPSSSFGASLAHYRYLDYGGAKHGGNGNQAIDDKASYYEYCGETPGRKASIVRVLARHLPAPENCKRVRTKSRNSTSLSRGR